MRKHSINSTLAMSKMRVGGEGKATEGARRQAGQSAIHSG